jgi:hypothetical protein
MEKDLQKILTEMKRLMSYDRNINSILLTEKPDNLMPGQPDNPSNKGYSNVEGYTDPSTGIFYRQSFEPKNGFFDKEMPLGQCFDITYFDANSNAENSMNIPSMKKDGSGYYFEEPTSTYEGRKIKIYLPKDEWFKQFNGVVKSFKAYKTCYDQKNNPSEYDYYTLTYQLIEPKKAVIQQVITRDGIVYNDSVDRGWTAAFFGSKGSGYFSKGTQSKDFQLSSVEYKEWDLVNYGNEYARSEFDIWYDSGWGTFFQFVIPILLAIVTAGIGNALQMGYYATLALEMGVELSFGALEASYLYERGEYTGAALAMIFAFIPLLNETKYMKNLAGAPSDYDAFLKDVIKKGDEGFFKTPGDVKAWIKGLPDETRKWVEQVIEKGSYEIQQKGSKEIQERMEKAVYDVIEEVKVKKTRTKEAFDRAADEGLNDPLKKSLVDSLVGAGKVFGANIAVMVAVYPLIAKLFPDDEELKKDPQNLIDAFTKRGTIITQKAQELKMDTIYNDLITEFQKLEEKVKVPEPSPEDLANYYYFVKETAFSSEIKPEELEQFKSYMLKNFYKNVIEEFNDRAETYMINGNDTDLKAMIKVSKDWFDGLGSVLKKLTNCTTYEATPFKTKEEICEFGTWYNTNYPNSKYPLESNPSLKYPLKTCEQLDDVYFGPLDLNVYLNYCGFKYVYSQVKDVYDTVLKNKQTMNNTSSGSVDDTLPPQ